MYRKRAQNSEWKGDYKDKSWRGGNYAKYSYEERKAWAAEKYTPEQMESWKKKKQLM